jgi:hypothetical protein
MIMVFSLCLNKLLLILLAVLVVAGAGAQDEDEARAKETNFHAENVARL